KSNGNGCGVHLIKATATQTPTSAPKSSTGGKTRVGINDLPLNNLLLKMEWG
ncbi:hypothetical protein Tco_0034526, partial [Tanacetum coccineum]